MLLCCGAALIDMIPMPTASGQEGYVPHVGGAVFNTAFALGRLGEPTHCLNAQAIARTLTERIRLVSARACGYRGFRERSEAAKRLK